MRATRRFVVSVVLVLLVAGGLVGTTLLLNLRPRLGLDLQGGLSVTLTAPSGTRTDVLDKTVEVLRRRVDAAGVAEPEISKEGAENILVQLPGTGTEAQRLLDLLGRTAQLQFRQVSQEIAKTAPNYASATVSTDDSATNPVILMDANKNKYQLEPAAVTGDAVKSSLARINPSSGAWEILVRFTGNGSKAWTQFTGKLACITAGDPKRRVAIVLDQRVESSPQINEDVKCNEGISGGETIITGSFTEKSAKDLALVLNTGALPVKLEQSEVRIVSPTLGRDALRAGLTAGALGLALVLLYVLFYYRALGLQTWIGLSVFAAIIYGLIVLLGQTLHWSLTLSGIAGLIVSVGIATDSYIVFFERIKEETHEGRTLRSSVDRGFGHAWRTLRTANFVTILAAITLYFLAVGPVRGFALALGIATTLDLVVTYSLTWPIAGLISRTKRLGEGRIFGMRRALEGSPNQDETSILRKIYRSEFNIDFIGRRRWFAILSGTVIAVSIIAMVPSIRGLHFGIDFKGGTIFRAPAESPVTIPDVKKALAKAGETDVIVQIITDRASKEQQVQVQTGAFKDPAKRNQVAEAIADVAGSQSNNINIEAVGQKWGQQITTRALRGLIIFLVLVILYMAWRLDFKMSAAGMVALVHDLIVTAGVYALVGFEVTPATVIATLTILGYSLYDTVVVFDKIRENVALPSNRSKSFKEIANDSTNQVLMRSINTSLTVLMPVGSLLLVGSFLLGADTLKDLALALFVGILAGTYSSIFIASPLLSVWREKEPRFASVRERVLRTRESEEVRPQMAEKEPVGVAAAPAPNGKAPARPTAPARQRSRKQSRSKRKKGRR